MALKVKAPPATTTRANAGDGSGGGHQLLEARSVLATCLAPRFHIMWLCVQKARPSPSWTAFKVVGMLRSATPLMFRTAAARGFSAGRTLKETDTEVFELLQKECKRQVDAPAERASLVLVQ